MIARIESAAQTDGENAIAAGLSVDHDVVRWMQDGSQTASPALLGEMMKTFAEAMMAGEAEALCNAGYRQRTAERANFRCLTTTGDFGRGLATLTPARGGRGRGEVRVARSA